MAESEFTGETSEGPRKKGDQKHSTLGLETVEVEEIVKKKEMVDNAGKETKGGAWDEIQTAVPAHGNGGKSLVLVQTGTTSQAHVTACCESD